MCSWGLRRKLNMSLTTPILTSSPNSRMIGAEILTRLLALTGLGLGLFGVYCFAEAKMRRDHD